MITSGSRLYFGFAALAFVAAIVYGLSTGGHVYGVFSLGYKEGVGEHLGYVVLMGFAAVSAGLGFITGALRDADPDAVAAVAQLDAVPEVEAPNSASPWPIVAAFAAGTMAVGLVVSTGLFIVGLVLLGIVIVEWGVQAWADRATGDPAVNRALRDRLMYPIEIPVGALLGIGLVVLGISRVLIAIPKDASVILAIVVASLILAVAFVIASKPRLSGGVVSALLVLGGIGVLAGGIVAAAVGPRDIEEHHEEREYEEPPVGGELPPEVPETTSTTAATTTTSPEQPGGDDEGEDDESNPGGQPSSEGGANTGGTTDTTAGGDQQDQQTDDTSAPNTENPN